MREQWAEDITARAERYWTAERVTTLLGDKNLVLPPVAAAPLLRSLGLLKRDGSLPRDGQRKYMQVNHMVALLEPVMLDLMDRHSPVRILDAACGRSYLSVLLAWCFEHRWRHPVEIVGVDRNEALIAKCIERAPMTALEEVLRFEATPIEDLLASGGGGDVAELWVRAFGRQPVEAPIHALLSLHACDTATDQALALGVCLEADAILSAPCCQAELARKWQDLAVERRGDPLLPVWDSPHLRREAAATMTDALRVLLLEGCGYGVTAMEFVPSRHTPKNTLLRAHRRPPGRPADFDRYVALRTALGGAAITLEELLPEADRSRLRAAEG